MTETQKIAFKNLTNPLTCASCGGVIERGQPMKWNRKRGPRTPMKFWHGQCECPKRARRAK